MITRLQVRNFKSLRDVDLSLGPVNVLVGPNMSGKSNIVDSLRFLQQFFFPQPATDGLTYALAQRAGIGEVLWKGANESLITFTMGVQDDLIPDRRFVYVLEIIAGVGGFATIQRESLKLIIDKSELDLIVEEDGVRTLVNSDRTRRVRTVSTANSALQYASPEFEAYALKALIGMWRFYQLVPAIMKQANPTSAGEILDTHGSNLSAWLMGLQTRFPDAFDKINEVVCDVFPDLQRLLTWPTQQGTVHLAAVEHGLKRPVSIWQMSDGQLAFIALLSLIYAPPDLGGSVYCLEEPENHLHPNLLSAMVALLRQVRLEVVEARLPLSQLFITTQSPFLVDQATLDEVIWVTKKLGETQAFPPANKNHLRKLIEDKELGLGDLMYSGTLGDDK